MNKAHIIGWNNYRKACKFYKDLELTVDSGKLYCLKAHTYCETQQPCKCERMKKYDRIHENGGKIRQTTLILSTSFSSRSGMT